MLNKIRHAFALGLPVVAALLLALEPKVPAADVGYVAAALAVVNYLLKSPLGKEAA